VLNAAKPPNNTAPLAGRHYQSRGTPGEKNEQRSAFLFVFSLLYLCTQALIDLTLENVVEQGDIQWVLEEEQGEKPFHFFFVWSLQVRFAALADEINEMDKALDDPSRSDVEDPEEDARMEELMREMKLEKQFGDVQQDEHASPHERMSDVEDQEEDARMEELMREMKLEKQFDDVQQDEDASPDELDFDPPNTNVPKTNVAARATPSSAKTIANTAAVATQRAGATQQKHQETPIASAQQAAKESQLPKLVTRADFRCRWHKKTGKHPEHPKDGDRSPVVRMVCAQRVNQCTAKFNFIEVYDGAAQTWKLAAGTLVRF